MHVTLNNNVEVQETGDEGGKGRGLEPNERSVIRKKKVWCSLVLRWMTIWRSRERGGEGRDGTHLHERSQVEIYVSKCGQCVYFIPNVSWF